MTFRPDGDFSTRTLEECVQKLFVTWDALSVCLLFNTSLISGDMFRIRRVFVGATQRSRSLLKRGEVIAEITVGFKGFCYFEIPMQMADDLSKCPEMILNKIEKTFNKAYSGLKSFLQRFQICFSQNPSSKGMESTSWAAVLNQPNSGCIGCAAQLVDSMLLQLGF